MILCREETEVYNPSAVPPLLSFLLFHQDDYRKKQKDAEWMELIWQFSIKTNKGEPAQTCSKGAQTYFLFIGKTNLAKNSKFVILQKL